MSMFENITDGKVDFYCDNRLAAIEDLDFVLTELKAMRDARVNASEAYMRLVTLINRFEEEDDER